METWLDIENYECLYQISNLGRVKSLAKSITIKRGNQIYSQFTPERILSPGMARDYKLIILTKNGKTSGKKIHRLVAIAFIPNPLNLPQVNHKDGVKLNNNADNLEWMTGDENMAHAKEHKLLRNLRGVNHPNSKVNEETALLIREKSKTMTGMAIAKELNLGIATISRIKNNLAWI